MYGLALHSSVHDTTAYSNNAYNYGYDCGFQAVVSINNSHCSDSRESTPDTITSEHNFASKTNLQNSFIMINHQNPPTNNDYLMQQNYDGNSLNYDALGKDFDDICKNINDNDLKALLTSNDIHKKTVCFIFNNYHFVNLKKKFIKKNFLT